MRLRAGADQVLTAVVTNSSDAAGRAGEHVADLGQGGAAQRLMAARAAADFGCVKDMAMRAPNSMRATASIVTHPQLPSTASGVIFVTPEDETGTVNFIVWPSVAEEQRRALRGSAAWKMAQSESARSSPCFVHSARVSTTPDPDTRPAGSLTCQLMLP